MDIKNKINVVRDDAVIMNNILVTGREGQTTGDRDFVNNCIYLADYRANKRFDANTRVGDWFEHFVGVFRACGWGFEEDPVEVIQPQFSGSVQQAWMDSAARLVTREQRLQVEAALAGLERQAQLLQKFSSLDGKTHKLNIVPMRYNASGELVVVLSSVTLRKSVLSTTYLFWQIHQATSQLDIRARKLVISRRTMDANRASVEKAITEIPYRLEDHDI